jgi:hypothetical protein
MSKDITLVTALWDIGRESLIDPSFHRKFDHYLECFEKLLSLDFNLYVYIDDDILEFVKSRRDTNKTYIHLKSLKELKTEFKHFNDVQRIRLNPAWYNLNGWLPESTQAKLEYYNPIVMSKYSLLTEASIKNHFNSKYLFWIDAGIANSVAPEYVKNLYNIQKFMDMISDKFLMLSFPYESQYEVHGFEANRFAEFCGVNQTDYVCRGGFFGGTPEKIQNIYPMYDYEMDRCFAANLMGTEENFLTILCYKYPGLIHRFKLPDSLVYHFFDNLKLL